MFRRRQQRMSSSVQDGQYDAEQLEFLRAMDEFKRVNGRPYPTWCEVLSVLKSLGWRKVEGKPCGATEST